MAVIAASVVDISGDRSVFLVSWLALGSGDTGAPIEMPEYGDRCVQFLGTWAAGTATFEGSNNGVVYGTLSTPFTVGGHSYTVDAAPRQVVEISRYMRPAMSAVAASINCYLVLRRSNPLRT